jgi:acylphosphatase
VEHAGPIVEARAVSSENRRVHLYVRGRVQGVWFRGSMVDRAEKLGLRGWVRNLPDGRVEAVIEGPDDAVDALVAWSHQGPPAARVDAVEAHDEAPCGEASFRMR